MGIGWPNLRKGGPLAADRLAQGGYSGMKDWQERDLEAGGFLGGICVLRNTARCGEARDERLFHIRGGKKGGAWPNDLAY